MKLYRHELAAFLIAALIIVGSLIVLMWVVAAFNDTDFKKCLDAGIERDACYKNIYWRNEMQGR